MHQTPSIGDGTVLKASLSGIHCISNKGPCFCDLFRIRPGFVLLDEPWRFWAKKKNKKKNLHCDESYVFFFKKFQHELPLDVLSHLWHSFFLASISPKKKQNKDLRRGSRGLLVCVDSQHSSCFCT